ncbi:hypothetical protein NI389_05100 [Pseudoalteromonas xiamenensis]|uniref:hypothetical protein n=1 Tax=Pseudoalteromonas xiamenensis TaxID=882626 RepID=UPI0027E50175|nr:hypothetical protein [Pseudoalteromonas xiamenensis]WMN60690.1 hypothetical protein NI389_04590 [Pseudoalteromonas xiamenensis]WMN60787.1 hypothetical protein NI389_05100 [Pseudoalteromonas xiamenensis]
MKKQSNLSKAKTLNNLLSSQVCGGSGGHKGTDPAQVNAPVMAEIPTPPKVIDKLGL